MGYRWIFLPIVVAAALLAFGQKLTSNEVRCPAALEAIRSQVKSLVETGEVPSLAIAVLLHNEIIWMEAFGVADIESNVPATIDTSYALASITKPFTATALMQLVEAGNLALEDAASEYLGDARLTPRVGDVHDVIVAMLASHTSGLPLHSQAYYIDEPHQPAPFAETLCRYGNLTTAPGGRYQYSNLGYGALGYILERLSGRSYGELMAERVFEPLGMSRTFVGPPNSEQASVAVKYDDRGHRVPPATSDCPAACAIYSSVSDLIRFAALHLGQGLDGTPNCELLSNASLQRMQTPTPGTLPTRDWECAGGGYGIGWFVGFLGDGLKIVDHSGGACGIGTSLILVPEEQLAVAVLTNTHGSWADNIAICAISALIPHRLANACARSEDPAAATQSILAAEPALEGTWIGSIESYEREIPLRLRVDDEGRAWIRIRGGAEQQLDQVGYAEGSPILMNAGGGPYLRGAMQGGLLTSDALRGCPCRTWIELRLNEDRLQGAVICLSQREFWTGPLSAWAELTRIEEEG